MKSDSSLPPGSITELIAQLKAGQTSATNGLWDRYFHQLVRAAKRKLGDAPRRIADEEDVALSVMNILFSGARAGRFDQLTDREDLWKLLVVITKCKTTNLVIHNNRQKRGDGNVRGESAFLNEGEPSDRNGLDQYFRDEPTPEFLALLAEQHQRLLGLLKDDSYRQIAVWKMESYTNEEIAKKLAVAVSTVERKVRRIREKWLEEADLMEE